MYPNPHIAPVDSVPPQPTIGDYPQPPPYTGGRGNDDNDENRGGGGGMAQSAPPPQSTHKPFDYPSVKNVSRLPSSLL